jgi:hypothetical protein
MDALHLKKILGGGDFSGENCDITPLELEDVEKYDTEPPEVVRELNLVADNTMPEPISGSFNTVVTKKCRITQRDEDKDKVLVYRRSIESVPYDEGITKFREYHEEMKLQIELAHKEVAPHHKEVAPHHKEVAPHHKGLAPHVYMYGILEDPDYRGGTGTPPAEMANPDAAPTLGLMNPAAPAPTLGLMNPEEESYRSKRSRPMYVYNFSVMEYKLSAFDVVAPLIETAYRYSSKPQSVLYKNAIRALNQIFDSIYNLIERLAASKYLPYDIKLDNLVLDEDYNTAYLIDCDPNYFYPKALFEAAMKTTNQLQRGKNMPTLQDMYKLILSYIFSAKTAATIYGYIPNIEAEPFMQRILDFAIIQRNAKYGETITNMLNNMAINREISNTPLGHEHRQKFRTILWTNAIRHDGKRHPDERINDQKLRHALPFNEAMIFLTEQIATYVPPHLRK